MNQTQNQTQDLAAEIERLKAENAALKTRAQSRITYKVSEKGALSVYGMGRWPVTLYKEQWQRLFAPESVEAITAFIKENDKALTVKDRTPGASTATT